MRTNVNGDPMAPWKKELIILEMESVGGKECW